MKKPLIGFLFILVVLGSLASSVLAEDPIQVYPLQALFIGDKALGNAAFTKAISITGNPGDRNYAISRFSEVFKRNFPNNIATINEQNKYTSFIAYLQIPRVSQYKVQKTDTLVDLYLPMTMTISFANMVTGEVLYTYTYTYYSRREATVASLNDERVTIELYRDTYNSLLEKVVLAAKENFRPFSVAATVKKEWQGLYILDKGDTQGITKGDTLIGPNGMPLTVVYAGGQYSVAQPVMGVPKVGMSFNKRSNGNLDELKKPKVMLMPGITIKNDATIPDQMVYQLFINALGKNAAFSIISIDKGFYDAQKVATQDTGLTQSVTQQRELPDYYLRLQFNGPVSVTLPSNKPDVYYDEHSVRACGDFLDRSGRVLYGKCVDEKVTDEIVAGIRFAKEDREEVVVKNALVKLADDFIHAVKFKRFELSVQAVEGDTVVVADKAGLLPIGGNAQSFRNIGEVDGIVGPLQAPTWLLNVTGRKGLLAETSLVGPIIKALPRPTKDDLVLVEGMVTGIKDPLKRFRICEKTQSESYEGLSTQVYYSVVEGLGYPLYDSFTFNQALAPIKGAGYGFKSSKDEQPLKVSDINYCVEPITKITLNSTLSHYDSI